MNTAHPLHEFTKPDELVQAGFTLIPDATLEADPLYRHYRNQIIRWWARIDELAARPPRSYQTAHAAMMACRPHNLSIWDMGVGKSFLACLLIWVWYGEALLRGELKPGAIQIVAPRHTLRLTWLEKELFQAGLDPFAEIISCEADIRYSHKPIWLYHYDLLSQQTEEGRRMARRNRDEPDPDKQTGYRTRGQSRYFMGKPLARLIAQKHNPRLLVLDEIHRLREGTDRTKAAKQVARRAKRRLGLSGTPMDGWVEHLATVLGVVYGVRSHAFPYDTGSFTRKFTRVRTVNQDWATGETNQAEKERKVPGVNPAQLPEFYRTTRHLLHRLMIRDPEVDSQVQFPPVNLHVLNLSLTTEHQDFYDKLRQESDGAIRATLAQLERREVSAFKARESVLAKIQLLRLASSCPWALDPGALTGLTSKLTATIDICRAAMSQGRKTIVFTNFIRSGQTLCDALTRAGIPNIRIYASDDQATPKTLPPNQRDERIETFQEAELEECAVMVANLELISEGLTLTEASVIVNHDHPWRALLRAQGLSRVVRPGQLWHCVDVYELTHTKTVDAYVWQMVLAKQAANKTLIDRQLDLSASDQMDALELGRRLLEDG